ncbi:MAG: tetratricopeptide repeat protein [Granulosicoccaceae bacterium]|jgi:TPR repeat protein
MEQEKHEKYETPGATVIPFPRKDMMATLPSASSGQEEAGMQYLIGLMYEYGRGVKPNLAEAVAWYRRAATAGLAQAQNSLGFLYTLGQGVARNDEQACKWFSLAAEQGHAGAQLNLGLLYCSGRGGTMDQDSGVYWFHEAARAGSRQARELLAQAYEQGWYGLSKNAEQAAYWSDLASYA